MNTNFLKQITAGIVLAVVSQLATAAEAWPKRAVQIVVPLDAGTLHDSIARHIATKLSAKWNQPVAVINQPGGSGTIGAHTVASSNPSGYTIGLINASFTGALATRNNLPFSREDLTGVIKFGAQEFMVFANKNAPFDTFEQMVTYAKDNPGKLDYASPGVGSYINITMEQMALEKNLKIVHVPYRNLLQSAPDVVNGRIHSAISNPSPTFNALVAKGDLKVIGALGKDPIYLGKPISSLASILPSVARKGYYGIVAPAGIPRDVAQKIYKDVNEIISNKETQEILSGFGMVHESPLKFGEFDNWIDYDITRIRKVVAKSNLKIE